MQSPSERRYTVTWSDGTTAVLVGDGDDWLFVAGGDPDDPTSAAGRVTAHARTGWPWVPGFSLPRAGLHDGMADQLRRLGATVTVDPPFPEDPPALADPNTIVG